jgi:hypothetical protein
MRRVALWLAIVFLCGGLLAVLAFAQFRGNKWAALEHEMQDRMGEFRLGRLRYRSNRDGRRYARWGIDANKGDRLFLSHLRRLTRVDIESIETIIDVTSDEVFNHPFIFAVSAGDWVLAPDHADRLRRYLERGGFLLVDDFHNEGEWASFMAGIHQMFPLAQVVELQDGDAIFHTVYDLSHRVRVPGQNVVHGDQIERGGVTPHWRGIVDEKGRIIVAICFNMDVGDGWEFADDPDYPEVYSGQAIRLGVNYVLYSLTH